MGTGAAITVGGFAPHVYARGDFCLLSTGEEVIPWSHIQICICSVL